MEIRPLWWVAAISLAALTGSVMPAEAQQKAPRCVQELHDNSSAYGWVISMRQVAVSGGQVMVTLGIRNTRSASGLIGVPPEDENHTSLVNGATSEQTPMQALEGLAPKVRKVERSTSTAAQFTFPHPGSAGPVVFASTWLTPIMQGAAQRIRLKFPINLPAREDCP